MARIVKQNRLETISPATFPPSSNARSPARRRPSLSSAISRTVLRRRAQGPRSSPPTTGRAGAAPRSTRSPPASIATGSWSSPTTAPPTAPGEVVERWMGAHPHPRRCWSAIRSTAACRRPATRRSRQTASWCWCSTPTTSSSPPAWRGWSRRSTATRRPPSPTGSSRASATTGPSWLSGYYGWEPERLVDDNYIDALALIRREALEQVGGYSDEAASTAGRTTICGARSPSGGARGARAGVRRPLPDRPASMIQPTGTLDRRGQGPAQPNDTRSSSRR